MSNTAAPPKVVFIMSTSFAGSTVLGLIISSQPHVQFLGEPELILRRDKKGAWRDKRFCAICDGYSATPCPLWTTELIEKIRAEPNGTFEVLAAHMPEARLLVDASKSQPWLASAVRDRKVEAKVVHISKAVHRYAASVINRRKRWQPIEAIGLHWANVNASIRLQALTFELPYLNVTYLDFVNSFEATMRRLGDFLDFEPNTTQSEFWKHPHHYIKGNPGTVSHFDLSRADREPGLNRELYRHNHQTIFLDDKWKELLSPRDLQRLYAISEVRRESETIGHALPEELRPSRTTWWYSQLIATAVRTSKRLRTVD